MKSFFFVREKDNPRICVNFGKLEYKHITPFTRTEIIYQ